MATAPTASTCRAIEVRLGRGGEPPRRAEPCTRGRLPEVFGARLRVRTGGHGIDESAQARLQTGRLVLVDDPLGRRLVERLGGASHFRAAGFRVLLDWKESLILLELSLHCFNHWRQEIPLLQA